LSCHKSSLLNPLVFEYGIRQECLLHRRHFLAHCNAALFWLFEELHAFIYTFPFLNFSLRIKSSFWRGDILNAQQ